MKQPAMPISAQQEGRSVGKCLGDARVALAGHYLFSALTPDEFEHVLAGVRGVHLTAGESLFFGGDRAHAFFVVASGQIKLYRQSAEGHEKIMELFYPGQSFAEAVMFMDHKTYPVSAEACVESRVYRIGHEHYLEVLRDNFDTCLRIMNDLSMRLRNRVNEVDTLTLRDSKQRLILYLINQMPRTAENHCELTLPSAKNLIASRLAIQPETLSRILSELNRRGVLAVEGNRICIHDIEALTRFE